ncbi:MAG: pilus assembly protein [Acidimicrobiales bacterium]
MSPRGVGAGPGRHRGDEGSAAIEMTRVVSGLLLVSMLASGGLRLTGTESDVAAAARMAARAASAEYSPAAAADVARTVVADALGRRGVACTSLTVDVAGDQQPGSLTRVQVICRVDLGDVVVVGFPGSVIVDGAAVEMVDRFRGGGLGEDP